MTKGRKEKKELEEEREGGREGGREGCVIIIRCVRVVCFSVYFVSAAEQEREGYNRREKRDEKKEEGTNETRTKTRDENRKNSLCVH